MQGPLQAPRHQPALLSLPDGVFPCSFSALYPASSPIRAALLSAQEYADMAARTRQLAQMAQQLMALAGERDVAVSGGRGSGG